MADEGRFQLMIRRLPRIAVLTMLIMLALPIWLAATLCNDPDYQTTESTRSSSDDPGHQEPSGGVAPSEGTQYAETPDTLSDPLDAAPLSAPIGVYEVRDVSGFDFFSPMGGGGARSFQATSSVETILSQGLGEVGASPVHIAFRGTARDDSIRCSWRPVARTADQRETAIRFWLGFSEDDPMPPADEIEAQFLRVLYALDPAFPETAEANFRDLARGGVSTDYVFLSCFAEFSAPEYILGAGPSSLTVSYDQLAEARSYDLYRRAYDSGELITASTLPVSEGEYQSELAEVVSDAESSLSEIIEGRESVVFLAPMGAHNAIAVEAWQAVAQWDLQTDDEDVVHAVRYGASEGDPEHTQTLTNLETRIETAAESDAFADERMENADELDDYYEEIGAYDDITPDDGSTATFTPAQPPPAYTCANGTAVEDPSVNRPLVHDCQALLAGRDTLRGTGDLDWAATTAVDDWEGISTGGTPSRVAKLDLPSESLSGSIPRELGTLFELTVLDLSSNSLTGDIPRELGLLENLAELRLSGNSLTGCIPVALEDVATNDLASLNLLYCAPPAPENLSAGTPGESSIDLTWDSISNTSKFRVEYRLFGPDDWTVDDDTLTTTTHTVDELFCESEYQFRVSAYGSGTTYAAAWSEPSAIVRETTGECVPPEFSADAYSFLVSADADVGDVVGTVSATDPDGGTITYSLSGGNEEAKFAIDASTGAITVAEALDYETTALYTLTVEVQDDAGNADSVSVAVVVVDSVCLGGSAVADAAENLGLLADCDVLLGIKDTLAGTATLNWSEGRAIDMWEGITVGGSPQQVVGLSLSYKNLNGTIPSELGNLSSLAVLDLSFNWQITGTIPSELGNLSNLTALDLSSNRLTGSIPSDLSDLTGLTGLNLSYNQLTGSIPSWLGDITSLDVLNVHRNKLSGAIPSELGDLSNLTHLILSHNELSGAVPSELGDLSNLTHLSLSRNELSGAIPSELGDLTSLTTLDLSTNQLSGSIPSELGDLSNLTYLNLGANEFPAAPSELGNLSNLDVLYLHSNQLSGSIPSWLLDMSSLTQLALGDNEFTGSIPSWLGDMNSLTGLFLHGNELTDAIPAELGNLSNLTRLTLYANQLDWHIPDELNLLANLETIVLQKNFELTGPAHLNFTALTHAELGYVKGETWAVADFSPATDWSLSSDDSDLFEISDDGLLAFKSPPDFVIPYTGSGDNVYFVDVTASVGGTQKKAEIVVWVMDRDIALSVSTGSMGEADSATAFTVTATMDEAPTEDTTVTLSLSGTATGSGADYTVGALPTVTILAGNTAGTATLSITPTDDEIVEGDEVIKVVGISGELAVSSAWITIDDDDEATLSLSGPSEAVVEGSEASFTVSLSDAIASDVTVEWSVTSGSATADDYGTSSGSVTFLANSGAARHSRSP